MSRNLLHPFILGVAIAALGASAHAAGDKTFLRKALMGDNAEMQMGQMAQQKGVSQGVKDFGKMLYDDHQKAKADALTVAQGHGVADTKAVPPGATAEQTKLSGLSGADFDREFARFMVKEHKKDIAAFEKQAKSGDKDTASLASNTLPALRKHLAEAERLAKGG